MSSTRTPRRASDGKPLPAPPPLPDEFHEEPTQPDRKTPTAAELLAELRLHAESGMGEAGDDDRTFHRRVL